MALADDAIALAMPVFACAKDKKPVTKHGFKDATFDHAEIRAQFSHPAAASIGVPTGSASGTICVDIDVKSGARGLEWLEANRHRLPRTRTHRTGSGGFHLLFLTPRGDVQIPNSASRVAPGVDVRGEGGYIIVPPSPGYGVVEDAPVVDMPDWLVAACLPPRPEPQERSARQPQPDTGGNTKYGLAALSDECDTVMNAHPGTQEIKLNEAALKIGGLVKGGELDRGFAFSALVSAGMGMVNAGKPWTSREIEEKVRRGFDDATPRSAPERPEPQKNSRKAPEESPENQGQQERKAKPAKPVTPLPLTWFEDAAPNLDAIDFVEDTLTEGGMSVAYGESNSGKTFFASDLAMHVALGRAWRGKEVDQGGVIYLALEGGHGIRNRIAAFRAHYGLDDAIIPFAFTTTAVNLLNPDADRADVIETIRQAKKRIEMPVRLVVVDTLSRAMAGGNENAPDDMGALVSNGDAIRSETDAHLMWIHHSGKDAAKGARGHSLLRAATDTEIEIINDEGRRTARITKQRDLECSGDWSFTLKTVDLGTNRRGKPVTSCVVETGDMETSGDMSPGRKRTSIPKGQATVAYRVLCDLLAQSGEPGHGAPDGVFSVPEEWWRERFYDRALPGADRKSREKAFRRAADALIECRAIACSKGRVWL